MIGERVIGGVSNHNHAPNKEKQRKEWISNMKQAVEQSSNAERRKESKRAQVVPDKRIERNGNARRSERKVESWLAGLSRLEDDGKIDLNHLVMYM